MAVFVGIVQNFPPKDTRSTAQMRRMVAEFCRMIGAQFASPPADPTVGLTSREVQTLQRLLAGDSEKQIAVRLGVSPHTIHVYVKGLHRHFEVNSRGELLAKFIRPNALN